MGDANEAAPEWPTDPKSFDLIGKIGQGAFASVWRANDKTSVRECAIKVLNLDHVDSNLSEIRLEVQAMRLSSHPNVLACHTAFVNSRDLWLVTQLMRKGSSLHCLQRARRKLREQGNSARMEDHILYILHESLLGLQYIHDNGQIHRDIKAGNILLDGNGDVRIADFGVSGWLVNAGQQQEKAKTFVGTPCWMAPEVMEQVHGYDYKADIWSLGITALELAKGYAPYAKYPPMKVLILTIQEDPPSLDTYDEEDDDDVEEFDEEFSKSFQQLVATCLQKDPAKRPKSIDLLQSKHLGDLQDETKRNYRRQAISAQVCNLVEDVGSPSGSSLNAQKSMPGNAPVSIVLSTEENRPAGTTWVFADGSQVLASSQTSATVDDVMSELDQFGLQTGGEHYNRGAAPATQHEEAEKTEEPDDLNAFMDEFELNTGGENFRHPSKK
jgi:serine/threonine-protein kinase OSR1/STK39